MRVLDRPGTRAEAAAMAKLEQTARGAGPLIESFVSSGFRVGGEVYAHGLMLTPDAAIDWAAPALSALGEADLARLTTIDPPPEFILLGTGATLARPAPALIRSLEDRGIGVEAMDSRAAARAWGMLRGEGRHIAAALLPLA